MMERGSAGQSDLGCWNGLIECHLPHEQPVNGSVNEKPATRENKATQDATAATSAQVETCEKFFE
jgi:hypothetical protein